MKKTVLIITLAILYISPFNYPSQNAYSQSINQENERTVVTPVLDVPVPADKNLLYSCSFQLVWNEFYKAENSASGSGLVKSLNRKMVTKDIISDESYLTAIIKDSNEMTILNKTLRTKFGTNSPAEVKENSFSGIMFYSYLFKSLQFKKDFNEILGGIYFGEGISSNKKRIKTFGIQGYRKEKHAGLEKQVKIYDYKNREDFILILNSKSEKDIIVLANISPEKTLIETINAAENRLRNSTPELLKHADNLYIPEINIDSEHYYKELETGNISKAYQRTKFSLNKRGAEVKSEARIIYKDGGHERSFVFNKPFLIYLKEKGKNYPYFALWVNNTDMMTPVN